MANGALDGMAQAGRDPEPTPAPGTLAPAPAAPAAEPARRWLELAVFAGLLVAALAVAAYLGAGRTGVARGSGRPFDVIRARTAEPAPAFELTDLGGRVVRLDDFRGRVVVLNFWATWCAPCRDEMPELERVGRELGGRGLVVVAVNLKEAHEKVEPFAAELGLSFPVLLDPTGEVGERYRVQALPSTYFVGRDGALAGFALGYRDWESPGARAYLAGLLDAGPATTALGRPAPEAGASAMR
jgi:thiol-disulfide isomerase/thioredoxin